jgi:beta-glucanase (GH16 family)
MDARIRIPYDQGIWPAFWMFGKDIAAVMWPKCGEIDILENIAKKPALIHGTVHGPDYSSGKGITAQTTLPGRVPSPMTSTYSARIGRATPSSSFSTGLPTRKWNARRSP